MAVTETTTISWGSRISGSFKGILVGLGLFIAGFPLLFWNEGRTVTATKTNEEGAASVVEAEVGSIDPAQEGALIHLIGEATTEAVLKDDEYGVSATAFSLSRKVEMYQWVENTETHEEKKLGGKIERTTKYTYSKEWCQSAVNSDSFKESGHINPPARRALGSDSIYAATAKLGVRNLTASQIKSISGSETLVTKYNPVTTNEFFEVTNVPEPKIGDIRVTFSVVRSPKEITVVAAQKGDSFMAYTTKGTKKSISHVMAGAVDAAGVFAAAERGNMMMAWILRLVGFLMMYIGVKMVLAPLQVLADVVPFIGSIVGFGTGLVAFVVAAPCALITIAIAWFFYRPVLSCILLAIAGGIVYLVWSKKKAKKAAAVANAPTAA